MKQKRIAVRTLSDELAELRLARLRLDNAYAEALRRLAEKSA